jgi:type II secretory pathway component PulF
VVTNPVGFERTKRSGAIVTWVATVLACAYFLWIGLSLYRSVSGFADMYSSMGVELPFVIRFLVASYHWLFPVFFVGAAIAMIVKQFFVRDKWINLSITFITALALDLVGNAILRALYHPLFDLIRTLNK